MVYYKNGLSYTFEGGTTFEFTTAPEANDDIQYSSIKELQEDQILIQLNS